MAVTNYVDADKYLAQKAKAYVDGKGYQTASDVSAAIAAKVKKDVPADAEFTDTVYDDTALAARVTATEGDITTLKGTGAGSVSKTVDDAINEFATKVSNDNVVNTFKELVDYAAANDSDIATITGKITAIETEIGEKGTTGDPGTPATGIYKYADDAVAAAIAALTLPTVPTKVSELTNDSGYQTASDVATAIAGKADSADLATVATTGSFNDLNDLPSLTGYEAAIDAIFATT